MIDTIAMARWGVFCWKEVQNTCRPQTGAPWLVALEALYGNPGTFIYGCVSGGTASKVNQSQQQQFSAASVLLKATFLLSIGSIKFQPWWSSNHLLVLPLYTFTHWSNRDCVYPSCSPLVQVTVVRFHTQSPPCQVFPVSQQVSWSEQLSETAWSLPLVDLQWWCVLNVYEVLKLLEQSNSSNQTWLPLSAIACPKLQRVLKSQEHFNEGRGGKSLIKVVIHTLVLGKTQL